MEGMGLEASSSEDAADIVLAFHAPATAKQADVSCTTSASAPSDEFVEHLASLARSKRDVALADVAYCNGADPGLITALAAHKALPLLAGFAAWNTAGNTIGSALAQATLRWIGRAHQGHRSHRAREAATRAQIEFLFERLVDDYGYQTVVRKQAYQFARDDLGEFPLNLRRGRRRAAGYVRDRLVPLARQLFADHFQGVEIDGCRIAALSDLRIRLPWPRLFEIEVEARIALR